MDRQVCVIKTVAYSLRTDRHTDTWTDKSLKTEGPKILSNDIFYFRTVIIGGPITNSDSLKLIEVDFFSEKMDLSRERPWSNNKRREPVPMSVCYKIEARRRSLSGQPKWPPMRSKDSSCVITHVFVCYFFTEQCDCHGNEI